MTKVSDERLAEIVGAGVPCVPIEPWEVAHVVQELRSLRAQDGVRVKPLEWERTGDRDWVADCELGQYTLNRGLPEAGGAFSLWRAGWESVDDFEDFETEKAAKAAAQADYERRILSALDLSPAEGEPVQCDRCQGNGEIVTDWDRYRHPHEGDVGDEAVAECPDCSGEGTLTSYAAPSNPVISDEMVLKACRSMYPTWDVAMTPGDHEWYSKYMRAALTAALTVKPQSGENL